MNYHLKTKRLLSEWQKKSKQDGFTKFCHDGLMYKGEIKTTISQNNKKYWYRTSGNEEILWENAPKRVMFLNKDVPFNEDQDIREWIFRQHNTDITNRHYKNISMWLYGLLNVDVNGVPPNFDLINNVSIYSEFIDETPIAYINCKKESGGTKIATETLFEHIERYKVFLTRQIHVLNPDIIVCGGGSGVIKNFLIDNIYLNTKRINNWIYYNEELNKLIIDSFHPSYFGLSPEAIYINMMENYKKFLDSFPRFKDTCRK